MEEDYAFYILMENNKNSLYRQLTNSRVGYTKFYYHWFYTDEKVRYNLFNLRQKLGKIITKKEFDEFNKIRVNINN